MASKSHLAQAYDEEVRDPDRSDMEEVYGGTLKQLEDKSVGTAQASIDTESSRKKRQSTEERYVQEVQVRRKGSVLFLCLTFIVMVTGLFFVSPMLLLINNKEQLVNDLNDGFYAYNVYTDKVLGMQLSGGCAQESIECKFKTMSPMLKKRFERYGYTVGATEHKATERFSVTSFALPDDLGSARDAQSLTALRRNYQANDVLDRVYSSRTSVFQDQKFYKRLLYRFGLQQSNQLSEEGSAQAVAEKFDNRVANGEERFQGSTHGDKDDMIDANGRGVYSLSSLADAQGVWANTAYLNLAKKANTHLSLACAYATYGQLAENSLRTAHTTTIARFAMNYLALADDIKSGSGADNSQASELLASRLMARNSQGATAMDADSYTAPAMGTALKDAAGTVARLSFGRIMAILQTGGSPAWTSSTHLKGALNGVVPAAAADRTPSGMCAEGMSAKQMGQEQSGSCWTPASVPLASYVSASAGAAVGGMKEVIEKACTGSVKAAVELVDPTVLPSVVAAISSRLGFAAKSESMQYTAARSGVEAQDAIFAGAGIILGDRAQSLGMRPASKESFGSYMKLAYDNQQSVEDKNRRIAHATPWDISNPYSFAGSIIHKVLPLGAQVGSSLGANAATIFSMIPTSVTAVLGHSANAMYTQPLHDISARLVNSASQCGIGDAKELDAYIAPDMACNLRYSMDKAELDADLAGVIRYMTAPHPENAKESAAKVAARDVGADAANGTRMKQQAEEGLAATYVDKKTGKPNQHTEYAKFLEYCVNRADPWGSVGMVVEPAESIGVDDAVQGKDTNTIEAINQKKPSPADLPDSYFALGWGSPQDQDWYTGKRCVDNNPKYAEMLKNFRAYTMACGILAGLSGSEECWDDDRDLRDHNDFFTMNNIIFRTFVSG